MSRPVSPELLTRRGLFSAGALLLTGAQSAAAAPSAAPSPRRWIAYEALLAARLTDGGGGRFNSDFAEELMGETNRFRAARGLGRLQWDEGLAACARSHVADMAARNYFAHSSPEGFTHADRVSILSRDICARSAENLAWTEGGATGSPQHIERMWEGSPGHRQNLLEPAFGQVGYGVISVGGRIYAAGVYADVAVRLKRGLPLNISTNSELTDAIAEASPDIERVAVTAPFQRPTWVATPGNTLPYLRGGVWQFRPLFAAGGSGYDVWPGPIFHIG